MGLPGPGLEPVSLALADEFSTMVPPGKSLFGPFNIFSYTLGLCTFTHMSLNIERFLYVLFGFDGLDEHEDWYLFISSWNAWPLFHQILPLLCMIRIELNLLTLFP